MGYCYKGEKMNVDTAHPSFPQVSSELLPLGFGCRVYLLNLHLRNAESAVHQWSSKCMNFSQGPPRFKHRTECGPRIFRVLRS